DESAPLAAVLHAGLRVVGYAPVLAVERDDLIRVGLLPGGAGVRRVRLAGHDKELPHARVRNRGFRSGAGAAENLHFKPIPAAGRDAIFLVELAAGRVDGQRLPVGAEFSTDWAVGQADLRLRAGWFDLTAEQQYP